jgi:CARDB protein/calcineurin-like phosphoesterase family protein
MREARTRTVRVLMGVAAAVLASVPADARALPDLRDAAGTVPPTLHAAKHFVAGETVVNSGSSAAGASRVGYYLSRDAHKDRRDVWIGRRLVPPIRSGGYSTGSRTLRLPPWAGGRYRLLVCADARHRVREQDERNNCSASRSFHATGGKGRPPEPEPRGVTLLTAGDIASCGSRGDEATAALLHPAGAVVATLGDHVYGGATLSGFNACYDPSWGFARGRTRPAAGNHEYDAPGASGYFAYFGSAAGTPGRGWYSYDIGAWHAVVLNSNCAEVGGCYRGSAQERWLRSDLAQNRTRCTLAYWHHPLFTSDAYTGRATNTIPLWDDLYDAGAELILSGHAHEYERFAPQRAGGAVDPGGGIREFVVGTGGRSLSDFGSTAAHSERRNNRTHGVLRLTLEARAYSWQFVPVAGRSFDDSGIGTCH